MSQPRARVGPRTWIALLAAAVLVAAAVVVASEVGPSARPVGLGRSDTRPNIVFVLTDDLSWNLVKYMPQVQDLQRGGMTFTNYTVTDSLCCPSRASIFTGEFPHDTHIFGNTAPQGGFAKFTAEGLGRSTFATSLHRAGYTTGFVGKYLNGYEPEQPWGAATGGAYQPPGWSSWSGVGSGGYGEFDYTMADGSTYQHYGRAPADYLTAVAQQRGEDFIRSARAEHRPFLLEVATFAPHQPYTPAPQDAGKYFWLAAPKTPAFDHTPANPPPWLAGHHPLSAGELRLIRRAFDKRVEAVQAVDRLIAGLRQTLQQTGQAADTVFVFSSDNGYHLGEYRLLSGKQTAFDTDVVVPLIVDGPGIAAHSTNADVVENVDLRPTFDQLGGARTPATVEGRSLVPLLHSDPDVTWRTVADIEHHRIVHPHDDPDAQTRDQGVPPSYDAIRTATFTYVRYLDGDREYYDRASDPDELDNLADALPRSRIAGLDQLVDRLATCHGRSACWAAGRPKVRMRAPEDGTTASSGSATAHR